MAKKVIREGKWKCMAFQYDSNDPCGHENPGPALMCEKCHSHRPENVQFYLPGDSKIITDKAQLQRANDGPDWKCMHCNYDNIASNFHCVHCGKIRDESEESWIGLGGDLKTKKYAAGQTPTGKKVAPEKKKRKLSSLWIKVILVAAVALAIFLIYFFVFRTTKMEVEISGFEWDREIDIEEMHTVVEEDWDVPSGGRILSKERRQSGTREVYDHSEYTEEPVYEEVQVGTELVECGTEDKGNGYFETIYCEEPIYERQQVGTERVEHKVYRDEPVYDTWYTYEIDRWEVIRTARSSGNDQDPYWPDTDIRRMQREGAKDETYTVHLKVLEDNRFDRLTYETSFNQWSAYKMGDHFTAKVKTNGTVVALEDVE